ncbi:MAG TPA: diguanylate cyclase [Solimonas sp.]|nr:diguanylate cyclase [Solimonas sp.]
MAALLPYTFLRLACRPSPRPSPRTRGEGAVFMTAQRYPELGEEPFLAPRRQHESGLWPLNPEARRASIGRLARRATRMINEFIPDSTIDAGRAQMSIRTKLILALLLVTLLPFFGLFGFFQYSNGQQIERSGTAAQVQAADLIDAVARDLKHAVSEVQTWSASSDISRSALQAGDIATPVLEQRWTSNAYVYSAQANLLKNLQRISGNRFAEIFFTDARGNVVAATNPTSDFGQGPETDPPAGEEWWAQARSRGLRIGKLTRDASAGVYSVDISIALSHDGHFAGVLKAVYNVESLLEIIGKSTVGRSGHVVLVDAKGNIIAAPHRFASIIFDKTSNVSGFEAFRMAQNNIPGYTFENVPWVGRALIGVARATAQESSLEEGWSALVIVPVEEALVSARQLFWFGVLTLGAVALVVVGATIFLSARISRPLVDIAGSVAQIDGGALGVRVPHEGADEVGTLAAAINRMTQRLARYDAMNIEKIKQLNVDLEGANRQLEQLATTDALTGLANRRIFSERLEYELKRTQRSGVPLSLVMIDLDHFKRINDTHGHQAGDAVLREVGSLLRMVIRQTDTAARYGGEEMALILPGTDKQGALNLAEKVRKLISLETVVTDGAELNITASLGIASASDLAAPDASSMVQIADAALYRAKSGGRNRVESALAVAAGDAAPDQSG